MPRYSPSRYQSKIAPKRHVRVRRLGLIRWARNSAMTYRCQRVSGICAYRPARGRPCSTSASSDCVPSGRRDACGGCGDSLSSEWIELGLAERRWIASRCLAMSARLKPAVRRKARALQQRPSIGWNCSIDLSSFLLRGENALFPIGFHDAAGYSAASDGERPEDLISVSICLRLCKFGMDTVL